MIAITFALPGESAGLKARLRDETIGHQQIEIVHTGVGRKCCQRKIEEFLKVNRPDFLISSGFAGAADENFRVGDLILAENFSDSELLSIASQALVDRNVRTTNLFTTGAIVDSVSERNQVAREHGAGAIDMETEFIAAACLRRGVRMISLRAISDSAHEPFPAPPSVLFSVEKQKTDFVRLGIYLVRNPEALPRLLRFSRKIDRVRKNLGDGLIRLLQTTLLRLA